MSEATSGAVDVDGGSIHWEAAGDGPPVLCIQGVGAAGQAWGPQVDGLSDRFRCVTYDSRGVGSTTAPVGRPSIEGMAEDALRVMDAHGWPTAHLVGHSMGGLIAQAVAIAAPTRVRSLALLCTFATGRQGAGVDLSVMWLGLRMRVGGRAGRQRAALRMIFPDDYLAGQDLDALHRDVAAIFGRDLWAQPSVSMKQVGAMRRYDPSPHADTIAHLPALTLTAEGDRIAKPEYTRELAARFGVDPIVLRGSGHACTIQQAEDINQRLAKHWQSSDATMR